MAAASLELLLLLVATGLGPLALALGIDAGGEGVLELDGDNVDDEDVESQKDTGGLSVEQSAAEEAHGGTVVHGGAGDVEGEAGDHLVHQDAKVVTQEGASDAKLPCRRDNQDVSKSQESVGSVGDILALEGGVRWLVTEGTLVEEVADEAEREDGGGESVASFLGAAKGTSDEVVTVLLAGNDAVQS